MRRACFIFWTLACALQGAVTIDRIAAVVAGKLPVKMSDVERELRVTQFLNEEDPDFSAAAKKKALSRLIDQELIRRDMKLVGNVPQLEKEPEVLFEQIQRERFGGSKEKMDQALARYHLTERDLKRQLEWQLTVLQFIEQRFQPGVVIGPGEVKSYYEQHLEELKKGNEDASFEALSAKIRNSLEAAEVDRNFEAWLETTRRNTEIDYKVDELK